jgi:hypothetical protein
MDMFPPNQRRPARASRYDIQRQRHYRRGVARFVRRRHTAPQMSAKKQQPMTFERLMSRAFGKESSSFRRGGPRGLRMEEVQQYLNDGGDVNRRTEAGQTLLHIAADNSQMDTVRLLVSGGADINAKGYHGYTPLHLAVDMDCNTQSGRDDSRATELPVAKFLIDAGADESVQDDDGETARDIAVAYGKAEADLYDSISRRSQG